MDTDRQKKPRNFKNKIKRQTNEKNNAGVYIMQNIFFEGGGVGAVAKGEICINTG